MSSVTAQLALVKPGTLTVSTIDNFIPVIYRDNNNAWQGFEVDILQTFAKQWRLKLEFKLAPFDGIWQLPKQGQCDIAAAGISVSKGRSREGAAFTEPYLFIKQSLLVKKVSEPELKDEGKNLKILSQANEAIFQEIARETYQIKKTSEFTIAELEDTDEKFALVVADHNSTLLALLNQYIIALRESGELEKLYKKWC
jgi:ABC-type amino acid transport substrate-binding protein